MVARSFQRDSLRSHPWSPSPQRRFSLSHSLSLSLFLSLILLGPSLPSSEPGWQSILFSLRVCCMARRATCDRFGMDEANISKRNGSEEIFSEEIHIFNPPPPEVPQKIKSDAKNSRKIQQTPPPKKKQANKQTAAQKLYILLYFFGVKMKDATNPPHAIPPPLFFSLFSTLFLLSLSLSPLKKI